MNRPAVEVADLLHKQGDRFIHQSPWLSYQQLSVLRAIARCRTAALGGHIDQCSQCGHQAISYNSCRNRHCPKCQAQARQRWLGAWEKELLTVPYFHVVFTLPHEVKALCQRYVPGDERRAFPCQRRHHAGGCGEPKKARRRSGSSVSCTRGGKTCSCILIS